MRSPGINGEGELSGQPANPGSPGKMAVKMECVYCVCVHRRYTKFIGSFFKITYFQIHRQTWVESDRIDIGSGQIVGERGGTAFPFRFGGGTPFP